MQYVSGPTPHNGQNNQDSPWWSDGQHDPWRNPSTPAVIVTHPAAVAPPLELPPAPPPVGPRRGLGQLLTVAIVAALLAGALGGTLGYVFAVRSGVGGGVALLGQADSKPSAVTNRPPESFAGVAKKVLPSLVTLRQQNKTTRSSGSGFIVSTDGYLVTNAHVANGIPDVPMQVIFEDGSQSVGTKVGEDPESDIAVFKVDRTGLTPVTFGDSDKLAVGDPVLAFGSPLGQDRTVTSGIVSALDRVRPALGADGKQVNASAFFAAVQTDAPINPGNSGGPLVDGSGRVIGVDEQIVSNGASEDHAGSIGLGFAVPINQVRRVATEIIATGNARRTVVGASLDLQYPGPGAQLTAATDGGPAARAGLKAGDVITVFNGHVIDGGPDLIAQTRKLGAGAVVTLEYRREGGKKTAQVTLAADTN